MAILGDFFQPRTNDFIGPFLRPYMGVVANPNMAYISQFQVF